MESGISVKSNIAWNTAGSLFYSGCQWLTTVLVVRLSTGYDAAGILALAMSVSNIYAPIALYRIRPYQVSDIHQKYSAGEYVALRLITVAAGLAVTLVYMVATCSPSSFLAIVLYLVFRTGDLYIDVLHGVDQQHFRMDYCGKSMLMRSVLFTASFAVVLRLTNSLEAAIAAMALTTYPVIAYDTRRAGSFADLTPKISAAHARELLLECLPSVAGTVLCSAVVTIARQYLASAQGDAALGIYATISTPIVLIQACASYVYSPLMGLFAERLDVRDRAGFNALLGKVLLGLAAVFAVGAALFAVAGEWLLALVFGAQTASYSYLMYAAILSSALTATVAFLCDLSIIVRDMRGNLIANVVACAASLPLTMAFVGAFGMNGVSYAIAAAYAAADAVMLVRLTLRLRSL